MQSISAGLDETQAGIKTAGRNINNFRYADDTTLMAESEGELKSLLMKVNRESHGPRSLAGYSPWGRRVSDTTDDTWQAHMHTLVEITAVW